MELRPTERPCHGCERPYEGLDGKMSDGTWEPLDSLCRRCDEVREAAALKQARALPELKQGENRYYTHHDTGGFYVRRMEGPGPRRADGVSLPFFCNGRYFATEAEAVAGFYDAARQPPGSADDSYARADANLVRPGVFEE